MDFDGDGEFNAQDAAALGGIMGFAEESMREENESSPDVDDDNVEDMVERQLREPNLRLIYNMNPKLFMFIAKRVVEQQKLWREQRLLREEQERQLEKDEFFYELEALERTEKLSEDGAKQ